MQYKLQEVQPDNSELANMSDLLKQIINIVQKLKDDELKLQQILDYIKTEVVDEESIQSPIDELPEKLRPLVNEIAQYIDMDMICYLNIETAEIDFIPLDMYYDVDSIEDPEKIKQKLLDLHEWEVQKFLDWDHPIEFRPFSSAHSFRIMEAYVEQLPDDEHLTPSLVNALRNRKPFANFGRIIDNSNLRDNWFEFKQQWLDNVVAQELLTELEDRKEKQDEI